MNSLLLKIRELYAEYKSPYHDGWTKRAYKEKIMTLHKEIDRIVQKIKESEKNG
jgi:hypothetical protein